MSRKQNDGSIGNFRHRHCNSRMIDTPRIQSKPRQSKNTYIPTSGTGDMRAKPYSAEPLHWNYFVDKEVGRGSGHWHLL